MPGYNPLAACCHGSGRRPNLNERGFWMILKEAYDPFLVILKVGPTWALRYKTQNPTSRPARPSHPFDAYRVCKIAALVVSGPVGRMVCGWKQDENRLLDYVGRQSAMLCVKIYGQEVTEREVIFFLRRRIHLCVITASVTAMQIALQISGVPQAACPSFTTGGVHSVLLSSDPHIGLMTPLSAAGWCGFHGPPSSRHACRPAALHTLHENDPAISTIRDLRRVRSSPRSSAARAGGSASGCPCTKVAT